MLEMMGSSAPPLVAARERLSEQGFKQLATRLREVVMEHSIESPGGITLRLAYMQAIARRSDMPVGS